MPALTAPREATRASSACRALEIAEQAAAGDAGAVATLERFCDRLARGLATGVTLLDPEVIVLGGSGEQRPNWYRRAAR